MNVGAVVGTPPKGEAVSRRGYVFVACWLLTSAGLGWQLVRQDDLEASSASVVALTLAGLLACTVALLYRLGWPPSERLPPSLPTTRRVWFAVVVLGSAAALVTLVLIVGPLLLLALPVAGIVLLALLRQRIDRREIRYAAVLAVVAGVAGLGAGWIEDFSPVAWGLLQIPLVFVSLLAGWSIARHTGLLDAGIGRSVLLSDGAGTAGRAVALGVLIGVPWGLANIVLGAAADDTWVQSWWRPLVAIEPAIAEEAWGRVFLVPLLFLLFRRSGRAPMALTVAVLVAGYWFAFLHTYDKSGAVISAAMIGTLYVLPLSYLWMNRGLEAAIGFHFVLDFLRFVAAYLFYQ